MEVRKIKLPVGYLTDEGLKKVCELRPLTGKALLRCRAKLADNQDPSLFLDLLAELVAKIEGVENFDPAKLFWVDADYIFFEAAKWEAEAAGEPMMVRRTCPHCGRLTESPVKVDEIEIKPVENTLFGRYPDLLIPVKLAQPLTTLDPDGKPYHVVKIGLLTTGDEVERIRKFGQQPGKLWVEGVRCMIYEAGPKKKGELTLADIEQMSARDLKKLERIYLDNEPGLGPVPALVCRYCDRPFTPDPVVTWVFDFLLVPMA